MVKTGMEVNETVGKSVIGSRAISIGETIFEPGDTIRLSAYVPKPSRHRLPVILRGIKRALLPIEWSFPIAKALKIGGQ